MNTWPNREASGGPCGGWNNESLNNQKKSDHVGLTQVNRPPRKSVRFKTRNWTRIDVVHLNPEKPINNNIQVDRKAA